MILKCKCGNTATTQPYKLASVHIWICDDCRSRTKPEDTVLGRMKKKLGPHGETGRHKGLKIPRN